MNFAENNMPLITVADIGGTHITSGLYNVKHAEMIANSIVRKDVDSNSSAEDILHVFVSALSASAALAGKPVTALAIAMPGPFDYDKGISYIKGMKKYDALYGYDLKQYFAAYFHIDPNLVVFRNDAEASIAGEVAVLGSKSSKGILGLTLGTGFGSAISQFGETRDANFCLEPFLDSIADDYFSTRWFIYRYWQLTGVNVAGVMGLVNEKNTKVVKDIFMEFSKNLITFLKPKLSDNNIGELIICGNIAKAQRFFLTYLTDSLKNISITIGTAGENAGMIGAAEKFHLQTLTAKSK